MFPLKDNVPTRTFPIITVSLIVVNVLVWIWEINGGIDREVIKYGYYPCEVGGGCIGPATHHQPLVVTLFTSMFMHGGWLHIIGNMLFLWIFGNNVEDAMGRVRFLTWYVLCGIAATGTQTFVTIAFASPQDASIPNIGASGAIAGVLGAYLLLLPRAQVLTAFFLGFFFFLREIPAIFFLGFWFLFQAWEGGFSLLIPQAGGGVAFFAHIGGFVFGAATVYLFTRGRRPLSPTW
ncbi:MAG: rhomboid family intramembrane serine protease [Actinomycetota bacterium]|nr:rhomboid family intramembrane serine protease [Actinomycetota bacterium]